MEWDLYILKKIEFSVFATILDAILDFSARHQVCQFMPAVSETTNITEHFGTNTSSSTGWGGGNPGSQIFGWDCHPTNTNGDPIERGIQ